MPSSQILSISFHSAVLKLFLLTDPSPPTLESEAGGTNSLAGLLIGSLQEFLGIFVGVLQRN